MAGAPLGARPGRLAATAAAHPSPSQPIPSQPIPAQPSREREQEQGTRRRRGAAMAKMETHRGTGVERHRGAGVQGNKTRAEGEKSDRLE